MYSYLRICLAIVLSSSFCIAQDTLNRLDKTNCKFGYWKVYKEYNGKKVFVEEGNFVNNRKSGLWVEYYHDGSVKSKINFTDGRPDGSYSTFYNNGILKEEGVWKREWGVKKQIQYYESGKIKSIFEKGVLNGAGIERREFYENGNLKFESWGDTLTINYYQNGNRKSLNRYHNGVINGEQITYYLTEEVATKLNYVNSKRHGVFFIYYENGSLAYTGEYKNEKMFGQRLCYNEAGDLMNGDFVLMDVNGLVTHKGHCINGKPEGVMTVYNPSGGINMEVNFKYGKPHGLTRYYSVGKIYKTENYLNGIFLEEVPVK